MVAIDRKTFFEKYLHLCSQNSLKRLNSKAHKKFVKGVDKERWAGYISKAAEGNGDAETTKVAPRANFFYPEPRQLYSLKAYSTSLISLTRL